MKKRFCLLLVVVILLFSGCNPPSGKPYFKAEDIEKAERIVFVICKNEDPKKVDGQEEPIVVLDMDKITEVKELDKSKISDFAKDFSNTLFWHPSYSTSTNSPIGFAVLIYFDNGEILVVSDTAYSSDRCYYITARFDSEGSFVEHLGRIGNYKYYKSLLIKYFSVC